ncbi:MAG TPA: hypothetical protein VEA69_10340 [Tepidisphaeraceae bacterium]|nr:hypothetical protein [Tepidisphaeraceae bacterium]
MKHFIWLPLVLALAAGAAWLVLRGATGNPRTPEVVATGAITIGATLAALVPITLARHASPVAVFQAAMGGTIIHLFLMIAVAGAVFGLGLVADPRAFMFLILVFYFVSQIALLVPMVRIFRAAAERARLAAAANPSPSGATSSPRPS